MACAEPFLEQNIHPTVIIQGYRLALEDIIVWCKDKFRCAYASSSNELHAHAYNAAVAASR